MYGGGGGGESLLHFHHFRPHTFSEEDFVDERTLGPHVLSCSNVEGNSSIIMDNQRMNKIISKVYSKRFCFTVVSSYRVFSFPFLIWGGGGGGGAYSSWAIVDFFGLQGGHLFK